MSNHVAAGDSAATFMPGPPVCSQGELYAWDSVSQECFEVYGLGITIADLMASDEGGFSVFNLNVHRNGTQRACANCYQLQGPIA